MSPKSSLDGWWDTISRWIGELFSGPDRSAFIGEQYAGGICGSNTGDISACTVTNLTITNLASSRAVRSAELREKHRISQRLQWEPVDGARVEIQRIRHLSQRDRGQQQQDDRRD